MPAYRFYKIDSNGHITGPAPIVECRDDQAAIREARLLVDDCDIEIWHETRVATYLTADNVSATKA